MPDHDDGNQCQQMYVRLLSVVIINLYVDVIVRRGAEDDKGQPVTLERVAACVCATKIVGIARVEGT